MRKSFLAATAFALAAANGPALAETFTIDLTHPIPTFQPMAGDPSKPDLNQPWLDSKPIASFGQQAILSISAFPTNQGHFDLGQLVLSEHHGTHLDTPGHYVNEANSQESAGIPIEQRKLVHALGSDDLIGKAIIIDISSRVDTELAKNGGKPSPDKSVTDFSNSSNNVVTADDIEAVADQLENGVWLALNLGWSKFFFQGADFAKDPYINGWNHPGMNKEAVDKLIEIMEQKQILIGGIMADNIGIESGQSAIGDDDKWTNSWHAHVRLLQRGVKFIENATNLDQLAAASPGSCTVVVGAPKHVRGTGGPSRVLALCER
ncbi:MAG TPA: cyclase family protein [Alphaproteobacteria bacterium]|nr:cyclase family protein [Alphaproteobacteria bacterium]